MFAALRRPLVFVTAAVLTVAVAGCSGAEGGGTTSAGAFGASSAPSSEPPAESRSDAGEDVRTIEVTVSDGEVSPPPAQVDLAVGETLRVVVTSDSDSELHAHGFEVEVPVPAGEPTAIELTGTEPGVFEVELHHPDLQLLQVAVR